MSKEKNKGRPPKFKSIEELEKKINQYYAKCDAVTKIEVQFNKAKKCFEKIEVPDPDPYTIMGLLANLGVTKEWLSDQIKTDRHGFSDLLTRTRIKVAESYEVRGLKGDIDSRMASRMLGAHFGVVEQQKVDLDAKVKGEHTVKVERTVFDFGGNDNT